ncbi:MAG: polysaccharide biosynthesis C-terminal domain-containing protein [Clostridia bacterium]|nr:polysaccharide biosynthesis C-terminal domain-containing protein [Clostridia bacterium]
MNNRFKVLKWNSLLALCYQVILIVTGLILPRCFLHFYGSAVNGLITSITQFLSFINICDLGISAVVSSSYYKPLSEQNSYEISRIFVYARRFFRVIGFILLGYLAFLLLAYPTLINDEFDYWFTFTLIAAMGISQLAQYFIGISYQLLLNADQKSYVQLIVNGSTLILNTVASVLLMVFGASIQVVKLATSLLYLLRPLVMWWYVRRNYTLNLSVPVDGSVVTQKKSGIIQHIAHTLYENTDVMVLTVFSTLENVSIYGVYTLVTSSIRQLVTAAITGVQALLGNMIANEEQDNLSRFYSLYHWGLHTIAALLFTVTGLLIVPFVRLYTADVTDADYHVPVFAVLITLAYFLSTIRHGNYVLIRAAGHYKRTQHATLIESTLNLVISVVCVFRFGLIGVAVGTVAATLFFVVYEMLYFSKNIVFMPIKRCLRQWVADLLSSAISIVIAVNVNLFTDTVLSWLWQAVVVTGVCIAVNLLVQLIFCRDDLSSVKALLVKKLKR